MAYVEQLKTVSFVAVGLTALLLAGCVSGKPAPDTYTSRSGAVTNIESDRESCIRSCNNEYARCGDMQSTTHSDVGSDPGIKTFGIDADCREALKACLPKCKGR